MARKREEEDKYSMRIRALDSKMSVVAQRMKTIEKNEKILAKTVTRNNKRIKGIKKDLDKLKEDGISKKSSEGKISKKTEEDIKSLKEDVESLKESVEDKNDYLKNIEDKLDEVNYVLDTLNPLEYLTSKEISNLIDKKLDERLED